MDAFMRSPDAVLELSAYHEAPPQPFFADAVPEAMTEPATTAAAIAAMRIVFAKGEPFPSVSFCGTGIHWSKMAKKCPDQSRNINYCNINGVKSAESALILTQPLVNYTQKTVIKHKRVADPVYSSRAHKKDDKKLGDEH